MKQRKLSAALAALAAIATIGLSAAQAQVLPDSHPADEEAKPPPAPDFGKRNKNPGPCPTLGVLYDASRQVEMKRPDDKYGSIGFTGEINGVSGQCSYRNKGATPIEMQVKIKMGFGRGPMAEGDSHTYRYWVAVTRTDVAPMAKQYFDVPVRFENGARRLYIEQEIKKIVIPRATADVSGAAFEILVGFDLSEEQLAFNRAGKRFKIDAGKHS